MKPFAFAGIIPNAVWIFLSNCSHTFLRKKISDYLIVWEEDKSWERVYCDLLRWRSSFVLPTALH